MSKSSGPVGEFLTNAKLANTEIKLWRRPRSYQRILEGSWWKFEISQTTQRIHPWLDKVKKNFSIHLNSNDRAKKIEDEGFVDFAEGLEALQALEILDLKFNQ